MSLVRRRRALAIRRGMLAAALVGAGLICVAPPGWAEAEPSPVATTTARTPDATEPPSPSPSQPTPEVNCAALTREQQAALDAWKRGDAELPADLVACAKAEETTPPSTPAPTTPTTRPPAAIGGEDRNYQDYADETTAADERARERYYRRIRENSRVQAPASPPPSAAPTTQASEPPPPAADPTGTPTSRPLASTQIAAGGRVETATATGWRIPVGVAAASLVVCVGAYAFVVSRGGKARRDDGDEA
ncbi:hypothetical protein H8R18_07135 [Nanchangia anserum]|uniref:Uncharacterized protein n=1 Tax=Nanchangia anserum TaxID=2692125 RepID=A0A8I0KRC8_9ACTO|nr:hypothetical protein [Nanchangia anserum]MBD3689302.1 hypothetical protein [Nanchangia anserum]QOX81518.1 hypothetical protein H8R18_07135 [Nanchangia anserum]